MTGPASRRAELLLTAAYAYVVLANFPGEKILLALIPVVALLVWLDAGGRTLLQTRVPLALLLFMLWGTLSYGWSADRFGSQRAIVVLVASISTGFFIGSLLDLRQARLAVTRVVKLAIAVTVAALVVAPGWATQPGPDGAPGWHGTLSHKNALGSLVVVALISLWFDRSRYRGAWLLAALVLLVGSLSSTALALVLVVAGVLVWQGNFRAVRTLPVRASFLGLSALLLLIGLAALTVRPGLLPALLGRDSDLTGRTGIWRAVLHQIEQSPLIGLGWGGVWLPSSPPTLQMWREARFEAYYAHNGFLDVALQVGLVGAALLALALLPAVVRLWRMRSDDDHFWAFLLLLTVLLNALSESGPLTGDALMLVAVIVTALHQERRVSAQRLRRPGASTHARELTSSYAGAR